VIRISLQERLRSRKRRDLEGIFQGRYNVTSLDIPKDIGTRVKATKIYPFNGLHPLSISAGCTVLKGAGLSPPLSNFYHC